jgi:hypothetical protein
MNPLLYLEIVLWGLLLAFTSERHAAQRDFTISCQPCSSTFLVSVM